MVASSKLDLKSIPSLHARNQGDETSAVEKSSATETPLDKSFVKAQWMMPSIVERTILRSDADTSCTASTDPLELLGALDMSTSHQIVRQLKTTEKVLDTVCQVKKFLKQQNEKR